MYREKTELFNINDTSKGHKGVIIYKEFGFVITITSLTHHCKLLAKGRGARLFFHVFKIVEFT